MNNSVIVLVVAGIILALIIRRKKNVVTYNRSSLLETATESVTSAQNSPMSWKQLIETIRSSFQTDNEEALVSSLKDTYMAQMTFWAIFNQRYNDDSVFYPLPFWFNETTIKEAENYQQGIKTIKGPLLEHLNTYKPKYQVTQNGQIGRVTYGFGEFDLLLIGASSYLKGRSFSMNNQAQLAVEAVSHYARIPIVSYFFALPSLAGSFSALPHEINQLEASILTGTENILMEIFDELDLGGVITDELVVKKIEAIFERSNVLSRIKSLTSVTIPAGVTAIGALTFLGCSGLTAVTIPASVTSIGDSAFFMCSGLTSVTIPAGVTTIGKYAFCRCSGLTSVTIPASVTSIGSYAFSDCTSLSAVTIPDSVIRIGNYAFDGCSGLTAIQIPADVTSIGNYAFSNCARLTAISVSAQNRQYKDINGGLFTKDGETLHSYPAGKTQTAYAIPPGVTIIDSGAFYDCESLAAVTIPSGVTRINAYAFSDCAGLAAVQIPNSVTSIGWRAFKDCNMKLEVRSGIERRFGKGVFE